MQSVAIVPQSHTAVGGYVVDVYVLVDINDELAFRVNFHKDLCVRVKEMLNYGRAKDKIAYTFFLSMALTTSPT